MPYRDVNGVRLHYEEQGTSGSAVVLLHGLGSCGEDWFLQFPALADRYRVIAPDLRGHGRSSSTPGWPTVVDLARDVAMLIEGLQAGGAHVAGLSLGGAVGLELAADRPDLVRSLIAVNTFARLRQSGKGIGHGMVRLALLALAPMDRVGRWVADGLFPNEDQSLLRQAAAQRISTNPRGTYLRAIGAATRFDLRSRLPTIASPTLVVAGERDSTVPLAAKLELARSIPGARLEIVANSGHATPLDAPDAFNDLVLRFLAELDGAQGSEPMRGSG